MIFEDPLFIPIFIFILRVLNNAVGTFRVIMMTSNRRVLGFALASIESLLFAYTAGLVITDLNNIANLTAYVLGFATGGYVGLWVERRYLNIYNTVNLIATRDKAEEISQTLRDSDFGATLTHGEGRMGQVCMVRVVAHHRDVPRVINIARSIKPDVFITVEESRFIRNGWIHSHQQQHMR
jgi:uncharacterized protein YebE (UPF0316 family)